MVSPPFSNMRIYGYVTSDERARAGQGPGRMCILWEGGNISVVSYRARLWYIGYIALTQHPIHRIEEGIREEG